MVQRQVLGQRCRELVSGLLSAAGIYNKWEHVFRRNPESSGSLRPLSDCSRSGSVEISRTFDMVTRMTNGVGHGVANDK